MSAKAFFILCASALLVNAISAQCSCGGYGNNVAWNAANIAGAEIAAAEFAAFNNFAAPGYVNGPAFANAPTYAAAPAIYTGPAIATSSGGNFGVTVSSPIAPTGVTIFSENAIDGIVDITGSLPLLATIAFEGALPTTGAAGTSYSCGSGSIGMSSDSIAAAGLGRAPANQFNSVGAGYNAGNAGIINAELAGFNAGLAGANYAAPSIVAPAPGCGRSGVYY